MSGHNAAAAGSTLTHRHSERRGTCFAIGRGCIRARLLNLPWAMRNFVAYGRVTSGRTSVGIGADCSGKSLQNAAANSSYSPKMRAQPTMLLKIVKASGLGCAMYV